MVILAEITDVKATDSGNQFKGRMYSISAKMILKEDGISVFEQTFSESHKDVHTISDTMEKIRIQMSSVKVKFEAERNVKSDAEKEVTKMADKINGGGK